VSTQTIEATGVGTAPRVNLMPPEIAEAARFRRLQLAMGAVVVLAVVIVGGLYMHERSGMSSARSQLASDQAEQSSLQVKFNSLQTVGATFAAVHAKQALLSQALGEEIRWSYYLNDLSLKLPSNVWLSAVSANETAAPGATAASTPTPTTGALTAATSTTVGTINFSGVGLRHDDVAQWLDALSRIKGFSDPTFSNSTESAIGPRSVVTFATEATLTTGALSNRFTPKAGS
jgi:Tfp pilus assembly protein PilN